MTKPHELKACPFCGEAPQWQTYPTLTTVLCGCVGIRVSSWGPESTDGVGEPLNGKNGVYWCDVIREKWNTRTVTMQGDTQAPKIRWSIEPCDESMRGKVALVYDADGSYKPIMGWIIDAPIPPDDSQGADGENAPAYIVRMLNASLLPQPVAMGEDEAVRLLFDTYKEWYYATGNVQESITEAYSELLKHAHITKR